MNFLNQIDPRLFAIITLCLVGLKGLVLWKASKNNHKVFFVIILFLNTLGLVEITYLILDRVKFNPVPKKLKDGTKEK